MVELSIKIHMITSILLILSQFAFFLLKKKNNFIKFSKKFRFLLLIQNIILAMIAFTGVVVMAVSRFTLWNIEIVLMIFVLFLILFYQIVLYKKIRIIKSKEIDLQNDFKKYASKIYIRLITVEIFVYVISLILE